jgi:hypothetical protein
MKEKITDEGTPSTESKVTISREIETPPSRLNPLPLLWRGITEAECRAWFQNRYCHEGIRTFDGIDVRFAPGCFRHAFFESPGKARFSRARAERIRWIELLLQDPGAILLVGFDKQRGAYDYRRRVALWPDKAYLTVTEAAPACPRRAHFVTAFPLCPGTEERTLARLLRSPRWPA